MTEITITLNKTSIYNEVKKLAAYQGKKQTDATDDVTYDVMHITKEEEEMLDQYYADAKDMLMDVLKPFLKSVMGTGIILTMPTNWNVYLKDSMQGTVNEAMIGLIAEKWFRLNSAKNTDSEKNDADQKTLELRRKLYWKRPPILKD